MLGVVETLFFSKEFARACRPTSDSYVYSMPYYLATGRNGARIFKETSTYVVVAQHPHIQNTLLVYPQIGGDDYSMTVKILASFSQENTNVQLARYSERDFHLLSAALSMASNNDRIQIKLMNETFLDWAYPIQVLDTKATTSMAEGRFRKLMNKFKDASHAPSIIPIEDKKSLPLMKSCLHFWVGGLIFSGVVDAKGYMDFYEDLFENIEKYPSLYDGFVVMKETEPAGFTIWDTVIPGIANGMASLSRRSIKGMSEFQTLTACNILAKNDVAFYNVGGSESAGLNAHKLKYRPAYSLSVNSYAVHYDENYTGMNVIKLI